MGYDFSFSVEEGASPYGAHVYSAILDTLEDTELGGYLSDPTIMQVGSFLTSAYTIATSDGDIQEIVNSSVMLALDIGANLLMSLVPALADIIPIFGQLGGIIFAIGDIAGATQRAREQRMREEIRQQRLKDLESSRAFLPIGTGSRGETLPSDYFLQVRTEPRPPRPTGRVPSVGVVLRGMTEFLWSEHTAELATLRNRLGLPHQGGPDEGDWPPFTQWLPMIGNYVQKMQRLRLAIEDQSLIARPGQPTDGGKSVWPVYMDLLYAMLFVPVYPFGLPESTALQAGYTKAPALPKHVALWMWGSPPWERPRVVENYRRQVDQQVYVLDHNRNRRYYERDPLKDELVKLTAPGRGDWKGAVEGIYAMAEDWGQQVRPLYYADQLALKDELTKTLPQVERLARDWLSAKGLTNSRVQNVGLSIQRAVNAGVVSSAQATKASREANAGLGVAAALALAAMTAVAAKRYT